MRTELDELTSLDWRLLMLEEVPCEARHSEKNPICTGPAVARVTSKCGGRPANVCAASYEYGMRMINDPVMTCARCGDPCRDCWSLAPI